ncbi:MAG: hypothetical protein XXXJIFNMEKO3_02186 [Candidatus Erwinia impunctatus]|nr:hypothetical protein XXXJIFNMEKO_02186 [Culicoides impunctatus]
MNLSQLTSITLATLLPLTTFASFASQTISAYGSTLDSAEAHIATKARAAGAHSYKITSAGGDNRVYMTAENDK